MDIGASLSKKVGPLPAYGWLGIIAGGALFFYKWTGGGTKKAATDPNAPVSTDPIYAGYPTISFQNLGGGETTTPPPPPPGNGNGGDDDDGDGEDGGGEGQDHEHRHPFFPIALDPLTNLYVHINPQTGAEGGAFPSGAQKGLAHNPNAQNPPPVVTNA